MSKKPTPDPIQNPKSKIENAPPVGFGGPPPDTAPTGPASTEETSVGRQPAAAAPICPNCQVPCKAASSPKIGSAFFTYYRCPDCPYSQKIPRPQIAHRVAAARAADDHGAR
ncbi:MAG: hypothetical protein AB7O62_00315 [Pirellulales bacterium]